MPWVGVNFGARSVFKAGVLLVGESHYKKSKTWEADTMPPSFTIEYIRDSFEAHQFAKNTADLFSFESRRSEFWENVAFYNFVQYPLATSKDRPTPQMWREGKATFERVLKVLQPDLILVLSATVWGKTPEFAGRHGEPITLADGGIKRVWHYPLKDGRTALASSINHPSDWGWSAARWKPVVQEIFKRAGFPLAESIGATA